MHFPNIVGRIQIIVLLLTWQSSWHPRQNTDSKWLGIKKHIMSIVTLEATLRIFLESFKKLLKMVEPHL